MTTTRTWRDIILEEAENPYYQKLKQFVQQERSRKTIYPPRESLFRAFNTTPFEDVKVVILGQDPYHQPGQAMGLSFSVPKQQAIPKSLINIYNELYADLGIRNSHGDLSAWAKQGVLLLNTVLTVEANKPLSHKDKGWEQFTDTIIKHLSDRKQPLVFVLWGRKAQEKIPMIASHHLIIQSSHPSPLGAHRGFIGSRPFSKINKQLEAWGYQPIDWSV